MNKKEKKFTDNTFDLLDRCTVYTECVKCHIILNISRYSISNTTQSTSSVISLDKVCLIIESNDKMIINCQNCNKNVATMTKPQICFNMIAQNTQVTKISYRKLNNISTFQDKVSYRGITINQLYQQICRYVLLKQKQAYISFEKIDRINKGIKQLINFLKFYDYYKNKNHKNSQISQKQNNDQELRNDILPIQQNK